MERLGALFAFLRKKPVALTISAAITVFALWIALRGMDLRETVRAIASMPVLPLVVALFFFVAGTTVRGFRWHVMMHGQGSTFAASMEAVLVSIFFNGLMPMRTGEVVRVGYFARRTGAPFMSTASVAVLERTLDVVALALIGAFFLSGFAGKEIPGLPVPPWMLGAGAGSVVLGLLVFGFFLRGRRAKRGAAPAEHASRLARWFDEALHGLAALESKGRAALVFALSLTMWLVTMGPGMYVFKAVGIDVTFSDVAVVMVSVTFAVAAPASPGFVGTFHAGFVLGSELVGIPRERALPVAIVVHLISQIPFILAGGVVLATGGRRALARADAPKNEPSGPGAAARGK